MRSQWLLPILVSFVAFASYLDFQVLPDFLTCWNIALLDECAMNPTSSTGSSSTGGAVSDWLQSQFNKLYVTSTDKVSNFESSFSNTFSSDAKIVKNHETMSLESFKEQLQESQFAVQGVEIDWRDVFEEKGDGNATIVAGLFVVKRYLKFRVRVGPAERLQYNSFSAKVQPPGRANQGHYQIVELLLSSAEKAAPVQLQGIPGGA